MFFTMGIILLIINSVTMSLNKKLDAAYRTIRQFEYQDEKILNQLWQEQARVKELEKKLKEKK